jgi:hypothetical protein
MTPYVQDLAKGSRNLRAERRKCGQPIRTSITKAINPSVVQCDCRSPVLVLNEQGAFACSNPQCANFEKVFKPVEVKAVRSQKTYRETVYTAAE